MKKFLFAFLFLFLKISLCYSLYSFDSFIPPEGNFPPNENTDDSISPERLEKLIVNIQKDIIYGEIYKENFFEVKGWTNFQKIVPLEKVSYSIQRNEPGILSNWIGTSTGNLEIDNIIRAGNIQTNKEILFFEEGTFTLTVTATDIYHSSVSAQTTFIVKFKDSFQDKDIRYSITNIDLDSKVIEIKYKYKDKKIPYVFQIPTSWVEIFEQSEHLWDKFQIVCWIHYKIREFRKQVLQQNSISEFNNSILSPIFKKFKQREATR